MDTSTPPVNDAVILRSNTGGVTTLTLNRPKQFNALSMELLDALQAALDAIAGDPSVRVVVIAANGKAFCPGHDLKEMLANRTQEFVGSLFDKCCRVMMSITRIPQPVIARVHGIATAAGCQLTASCDLAVASTDAKFATSGVNLGLFCATPGVAVSRNVSRKQALEMLMTGEFIDAATALQWGLVNRVVPPDQVIGVAEELARRISLGAPMALAKTKEAMVRSNGLPFEEAFAIETQCTKDNAATEDAKEGPRAFMQKRPPVFTGR